MSSFEEEFPNEPNPQTEQVQQKLFALRKRMIKDLAQHLPENWLKNANARTRQEFLQHMVTSKTIAEIIEIVSWTALCVEHEEAMRAQSEQ